MNRFFRHSEQSATPQPGRHPFLSLGGRLGGGFLLLLLLLLSGTRYAHAQNSSANPFIDSWHLYRIPMANTANTVQWQLFDVDLNGAPSYTLETQPWVDTSVVSGNAEIEIKFINTVFASGQIWFLVYSEISSDHSCVARRSFEIHPVNNIFYLSLPADDSECNSYTGDIWDNADGDLSAIDRGDNVEFTVTMNKDVLFLIDKWRFNGSISIITGGLENHLATPAFSVTAGASTSGGTWTITGTGANFNLEVTTPADFDGISDVVTFSVDIEGDITEDYQIQLSLTNGQAISGTLYETVTDDNLNLGGDRVVVRLRYGVPNTSVVMVMP
jgi:hypothetical protein